MAGGGCGIWSIALFCVGRKMSDNIFPPLLTIFFIIIGMLLFIFGLMSEILIKTYYGVHVDSSYSVKEIAEYFGESERRQDDEDLDHIT